MMRKMRSVLLSLGFVLPAASCGSSDAPVDLELLAGATVGLGGYADGTGAAASFRGPAGVAVDSAGNIYVADEGNAAIRKVTAAGVVTTLAGSPDTQGRAGDTGTAASFLIPIGVAVDRAGNIYVADEGNESIYKLTAAAVVTTLAGGSSGHDDGTGAAAGFNEPQLLAVDRAGNIYVADEYNHIIRKVTADGSVTTLAGEAGMPGSADGTGAAARFNFPIGVAVDRAGNVYVGDAGNHIIRKVTAAGVVTTLAGNAGMSGIADGTGAAARFITPLGVAVDRAGNVYVADGGNASIRKITPTGTTTTIVQMAGEITGINLGTTPQLFTPKSLAVVGDSLIISDCNAILLLHHGAQ